jgi:uncharacterized membrane protein YeiB
LKGLFDKVASQEELYQIICVSLLSVDWSSWMECRRNYGPVFADWNRLYGILFLHAAALGGWMSHTNSLIN